MTDDGQCGRVRWCDESLGHDGPHRRTLLDVFGAHPATERPVIVMVNLEADDTAGKLRRLVLVVDRCGGVVAGVVLLAGVQTLTAPHCPTEDSCSVDYRNGEWRITEDSP